MLLLGIIKCSDTTTGPGIPPANESAFIRVNDDFDEGNKYSNGKPLPDNQPDAVALHRIDFMEGHLWDWDWDLAGMWLYAHSTDTENDPTYSLTFPPTVKVWRPTETPNEGPAWLEVTSGEVFEGYPDYYTGYWPEFIVEGIQPGPCTTWASPRRSPRVTVCRIR